METNTAGWIGLILLLFISSFGLSWIFVIFVALAVFILGYIFSNLQLTQVLSKFLSCPFQVHILTLRTTE